MARQTIILNDGGWRFGAVPRCSFTASNVFDLANVTKWYPASVPGNVRTDLLVAGYIADPLFADNYKDSLWVEEMDWWYCCTVPVAGLSHGERGFLIFDGIDYLSAIFINSQEVIRHQGMFSRQVVEVTAASGGGQQLDIAVRIWGSSALPRRRLNIWQRGWQKVAGPLHNSWTGVYPHRSATLKAQYAFGWDFAPPIRTMGIWDAVQLIITGQVHIESVRATLQPAVEIVAEQCQVPARLSLTLGLNARTSTPATAVVTVTPANFSGVDIGPIQFSLHLPADQCGLTLACDLPEIALWQPWERGFPHLYDVTVTLLADGEVALDSCTVRTGLRQLSLSASWQFNLNQQPLFIRGLNWVPADSFPGRLRSGDYRRWLSMARDSGANLLRVWGGGLREKQAFYDICDELGLLVWQEFPFACMFLGSYPRDSAFLALVRQECSAIVGQLRHHPALALWCGGNEFSRWRNGPLLKTLAEVVQQEDGTRPFVPTSPGPGDVHQWQVWHGQAPVRAFLHETAPFLSEFGLQALPHPDTLVAALPEPMNVQSWPGHHADLPKLNHYGLNDQLTMSNEQMAGQQTSFPLLSPGTDVSHPTPDQARSQLTALVAQSQHIQAMALQTAIEHMRRRKGQSGGVCLWQFNEPWPAISWAIVDYFGRPKLAYDLLKHWYNPVLISLKFPVGRLWQPGEQFAAHIWAINDTLQAINGAQLEIRLDTVPIHSQTIDLPANRAIWVGMIRVHIASSPRLLTASLQHSGAVLSHNQYALTWHDAAPGSITRRFRRWLAEWVMR